MGLLRIFQFLVATSVVAAGNLTSSDDFSLSNPIHLLRPKSGIAGHHIAGVSCQSWRFGVETNNLIGWKTIPKECEGYVGHYMLGSEYREDSKLVTEVAYNYAKTLNLTNDGNNIWVFDVDETTLSNLPFYAHHGFGAEPFNSTAFNEWVAKATAPALPESLKLYEELKSLGIKIVFLTGRRQYKRTATAANLKNAGYLTWDKLIHKEDSYSGNSVEFKSAEREKLEKNGYRIIGNMGDQWSDLLGSPTGQRTFKLPDPMYYVS